MTDRQDVELDKLLLDAIGVERGKERDVIRALHGVQSMGIEQLHRAAARKAGFQATATNRAKYRLPVEKLVDLGLLVVTSPGRVRLNEDLFDRDDEYVYDLLEALRAATLGTVRPVKAERVVRDARRELSAYEARLATPGIVLRAIARTPSRSGIEMSVGPGGAEKFWATKRARTVSAREISRRPRRTRSG